MIRPVQRRERRGGVIERSRISNASTVCSQSYSINNISIVYILEDNGHDGRGRFPLLAERNVSLAVVGCLALGDVRCCWNLARKAEDASAVDVATLISQCLLLSLTTTMIDLLCL